MRSVKAHKEVTLANALVPDPVRMAITDAGGLLAAEEVQAAHPLPGFAMAAIDGYAVRSVDVGGTRAIVGNHGEDTPEEPSSRDARLPVVGEIPAGSQQPMRLQPKQAMRVHTGAPLPTLADSVLPLSWSDKGTSFVRPLKPVASGEFVRGVGEDINEGDVAVSPGTILGPAQIGLLAAVGHSKVLAYPRPRVSVLSVGKELVDIDRVPGRGQVYDINSYALAAAAKDAGAEVRRVGIVEGEPRRIREVIEGETIRSEIILISGAVGGAGATQIQGILSELGEVDTTRVAMHPGSVQGFAVLGSDEVPCFLLPSTPVSSLVIFEAFVRPMIRAGLGKRPLDRRLVKARALGPLQSRVGRRGFIRARLMRDAETQDYLVEGLSGATGSPAHLLAGLAEANSYIVIPEEQPDVRPGDVVDVMFLSQG